MLHDLALPYYKVLILLPRLTLTGIGGFQVRARGKKDEEKAREEALLDPQVLELRRKRSNWRTKKKIKLLEKFPSYIQVRNIINYGYNTVMHLVILLPALNNVQ